MKGRQLIYSSEFLNFIENCTPRTKEKLLYATSILQTIAQIPSKFVKKATMRQKQEINDFPKGDLDRLRKADFSKFKGFVDAGDILNKEAGEPGSTERETFEAKARAWYYGEILRQRRKDLGLTQKELAEKVGRERTYITRIEKGETDLQLSSFIRIAAALGIVLRLEFL